jgi:hypothetical protein
LHSSLDIQLSTKVMHPFEQVVIERVCQHFRRLSYEAYAHVQLNVAWGPIISDVDVLLKKGDELTAIEVKSMHDELSRAKPQLDSIADYVDYAYVATDRLPRDWKDPRIGLLFVRQSEVRCLKRAKRLLDTPNVDSFFALRKNCLQRLMGNDCHQAKYALAVEASRSDDKVIQRKHLKEIVTCSRKCDTSCPIWRFEEPPNSNERKLVD